MTGTNAASFFERTDLITRLRKIINADMIVSSEVHFRTTEKIGVLQCIDIGWGGAGWNELESRGLGVPFPPVKERFDQLEATVQLCLGMWAERPHPPIMIGGGGELRTLRLVARYADACNLFPTPDVARKLEALRAHCQAEGRDYASIEKTSMFDFDVGERGENVDQIIDRLRSLSRQGIQTVHGWVKDVYRLTPLEILAERVVPAVAEL